MEDRSIRPAAESTSVGSRGTVLKWSLFAADVLIAGLVFMLVSHRLGRLSVMELAACAVGLILGAWLTCLALRL